MKNKRWEFDYSICIAFGFGIIWENDARCLFIPFLVIGWELCDEPETY